jgi:hypothetical protein
MRKATFPVRNGNSVIIVPVPPVDTYAGNGEARGNTASRPSGVPHMSSYYDTDLLEEIYWNVHRNRWEAFDGTSRA